MQPVVSTREGRAQPKGCRKTGSSLPNRWYLAATLLLVVGSLACSAYRLRERAEIAAARGNWDVAVMKYQELLEREPRSLRWKAWLLRAKIQASRFHLDEARKLRDAGALRRAVQEYRLAVQLDPTNDLAAVELRRALEDLADREAKANDKPSIAELKARAREWQTRPPKLDPRSQQPIDLIFPEPVPVKEIYTHLGKAFGINVIFDREMKDQQIAIELRQVTAQEALEGLMRAAGHFYKVLDPQTILVADDTPQNRQRLEDQVIQTFFLSNADPEEITTMLRSLIGARTVATNEELNAVVLRDNADTVRVAQRIIESNDKARGEVVIDVELIQLDISKLRQLGAALSPYSLGTTFIAGEENPLLLSDLTRIGERASWQVTVPSVLYQFLKSDANTEFLARPRLRISDGEEASLHIGDQVPIPVTQFNTNRTVGGNIVPITSFQYKDVGISINLTPRIHHNREITLELEVEVSNLKGSVTAGGGLQQPVISTRKISSTIRLADGETNILAGLIQRTERTTETGIPGIAEIPLLGRLFSSEDVNRARTDLVLTLTPHIIRTADITEEDLLPIWVGTEGNISFRGASPRLESRSRGPFDEPARSPEEIRQLIRERLEAISESEGQEEKQPEEPQQPAGRDLVAPSAPSGFEEEPEEEPEAAPEAAPPPPPPAVSPEAAEEEGAENPGVDATGPTVRFQELEHWPQSVPVARRGIVTAALRKRPAGESVRRDAKGRATRVELLTGHRRVEPGATFRVQIWVESEVPVAHVPTTLHFDPEHVEVLGVDGGSFLGDEGEYTLMWHATKDGLLMLGLSRLGREPGVRGEGVAAVVTLRARKPGKTRIEFEKLEVMDSTLRPLERVKHKPLTIFVGVRPDRRDQPEPREPLSPRLQGEA